MDCWDYYQLISSGNMSTECRLICWTRVGEVLVNMLLVLAGHWLPLLIDTLSVCWFTFCCNLYHNITAEYWSTVHGVLVDSWWYMCIVKCYLLKQQQSPSSLSWFAVHKSDDKKKRYAEKTVFDTHECSQQKRSDDEQTTTTESCSQTAKENY